MSGYLADLAVLKIIERGNLNTCRRPLRAFAARYFGDRQCFLHLGLIATVCWWRQQPYLIELVEISDVNDCPRL